MRRNNVLLHIFGLGFPAKISHFSHFVCSRKKFINYDLIKLMMLSSKSREFHFCAINCCRHGLHGSFSYFFAKVRWKPYVGHKKNVVKTDECKLINHRILKRKKCSDFYGELLKADISYLSSDTICQSTYLIITSGHQVPFSEYYVKISENLNRFFWIIGTIQTYFN